MPALPEEDVIQIARSYLQSKDIDAEFQANAEYRVKSVGCMYEFELAEEFESFGIGFVVEVDRNGQVIDFYSNE